MPKYILLHLYCRSDGFEKKISSSVHPKYTNPKQQLHMTDARR